MPQVSFVILAWNSQKYLEKCFSSIASACGAEGLSWEIIVVDNGSTDSSPQIYKAFEEEFGNRFTAVMLTENKGTTVSRNIGFDRARGDVVIVLDSDTELTHGGWAEALSTVTRHPEIGILAPRLLLPDGSVQHSVKKLPAFAHKLLKVGKILFRIKMPNQDFYPDFPFNEPMEVDSAISACWLVRREVLDSVGGLDEKIFYSPEDLDYCVRVRRAGLKIVFWPKLTVLHHTQQITHRSPFSKTSLSHFMGLLYFYNKHGGWFGHKSALARFVPSQAQNQAGA